MKNKLLHTLLLGLVATTCPAWGQTANLPRTGVPPMPPSLTFAGEPVPLSNPLVYDQLENELVKNVYKQSATLGVLKRVQRFREPMVAILTKNKIPADFFYVAVIESDLLFSSQSEKRAAGYWQFLESTAAEYGLEVSNAVDERRHPERATQAASQYFRKMYARFQNWTLSAVAFNAGQTAINNNLRQQNVKSLYDLYLTPETQTYIYRILAMKLICENPERYGFSIRAGEYVAPTTAVTIREDTNLVEFARTYGMTYQQLKYYNPWLIYKGAWAVGDPYYEQNKAMNVLLPVAPGKTYTLLVATP